MSKNGYRNNINGDQLCLELVQQFLDSAYTSRELLVDLIERVEMTENKQIINKFRLCELKAISYGKSFTIGESPCGSYIYIDFILR